ncbi:hypothetical protein QP572_02140 [Brevibacterium sp. UMB10442]|nr:hypothetical protein [Brevibacterium sp. UMB10442]
MRISLQVFLDQSAFEDRLREIGIDALEALQRDLATEGVYVPEAGDLPRAIVQCLLAIFRANEQKKDLKADPPANQPQFEIFEGIDLAQGRIAGNKLHLGRSTLPWKPAPDIPEQPDGLLEAVLLQSWAESSEDSVSHSLMAAACGRSQAVSKTRLTITASGFGCP